MNTFKHLIWLSVILLFAVPRAGAQQDMSPQPATKYRMELVYIFDAEATEFIFVVGKTGFKSVASLKEFLSSLPSGTTLEWSPGCIRFGSEPLLSSEQDMEDFKKFCSERNINFILVPAG